MSRRTPSGSHDLEVITDEQIPEVIREKQRDLRRAMDKVTLLESDVDSLQDEGRRRQQGKPVPRNEDGARIWSDKQVEVAERVEELSEARAYREFCDLLREQGEADPGFGLYLVGKWLWCHIRGDAGDQWLVEKIWEMARKA